jgi:hypothetical protein
LAERIRLIAFGEGLGGHDAHGEDAAVTRHLGDDGGAAPRWCKVPPPYQPDK